jgi:hypothetical protein
MKKSQLDRAIEQLDGEVAVLQAAKKRLMDQQLSEKGRRLTRKPAKPVSIAERSAS